MPELPEVHTTTLGLSRAIIGARIDDVWTDLATRTHTTPHLKESLKDKKFFAFFKKNCIGARILRIHRRAKNILIDLDNNYTILIHMKMTGHLLVGHYTYSRKNNSWSVSPDEKNEALRDPYNGYIHVVFSLSNNTSLVLSDARKFAKITLIKTPTLNESIHLAHLGPEPLDPSFTFSLFKSTLLKRPKAPIKNVLMDQHIIAGIGNIYSDEMLFLANIHPLSHVEALPTLQLQSLFQAMKKVLSKGIDFGGDSMSDYRRVDGTRGSFQNKHNVYRLTNKQCSKRGCTGILNRIVVSGRSAHFCPKHQKKYV
jgi:formamidopyrimidine-DNA glycosylase